MATLTFDALKNNNFFIIKNEASNDLLRVNMAPGTYTRPIDFINQLN